MYKEFRKKYPFVTMRKDVFCKILNTYFKKVKEKLMEGRIFNFRNQVGILKIIRTKRCLTATKPDGSARKVVDYGATKINSLNMTPEQIADKKHIVYRTNLFFHQLVWVRWTFSNPNKKKRYLNIKQMNAKNYRLIVAKHMKLSLGTYGEQ